jgi:hypothetical protein
LFPTKTYPSTQKEKVLRADEITVPKDLENHYEFHNISQLSELNLNAKQVLKKDCFIMVSSLSLHESILHSRRTHFFEFFLQKI